MKLNSRHFLIFRQHRRLQRLWQFFFTGWGLILVAALAVAPFFTKNLIWSPIAAIDMKNVALNQFQIKNASFAGTDKNGEPFHLRAATANQKYDEPEKVFMRSVAGNVVRNDKDRKITDKISASHGIFNKPEKTITLTGNVRIDSSNGDKIFTEEMVIKL